MTETFSIVSVFLNSLGLSQAKLLQCVAVGTVLVLSVTVFPIVHIGKRFGPQLHVSVLVNIFYYRFDTARQF